MKQTRSFRSQRQHEITAIFHRLNNDFNGPEHEPQDGIREGCQCRMDSAPVIHVRPEKLGKVLVKKVSEHDRAEARSPDIGY